MTELTLHSDLPRRPRVLAIDDSLMIHRLLKARLKSERLEMHSATGAMAGLEAARRLLPELILLDVDMPEMDGFGVLANLKADPRTHDIPVIFLSGSCSTGAKVRGLEMGAVDFITKPFDVGELKARVRSALRIRLLIQMLAQRAQLDGLTGLWNRSYFDQRLEEEVATAKRHGTRLALILCDLDEFKSINDTYGHPFGDQVLEEFARIVSDGRAADAACRYGGEEFAIILPRADASEAAMAAERFRLALRERRWLAADDFVITASFGVADVEMLKEKSCQSPEAGGELNNDNCQLTSGSSSALAASLLEIADDAMYAAKQSGRDSVVVASSVANMS